MINDNKNDMIVALFGICIVVLAGFATMIIMKEENKCTELRSAMPLRDSPGYYFHSFETNSVSPTLVTFRN